MSQNVPENNPQILIYQTDDNSIRVDVHLEDESVWLTQAQMAMLFDKRKSRCLVLLRAFGVIHQFNFVEQKT